MITVDRVTVKPQAYVDKPEYVELCFCNWATDHWSSSDDVECQVSKEQAQAIVDMMCKVYGIKPTL